MLVSAIVLMAIMLTVGLASFAFVDTGQKRSRESRERESSLSLAEAALYAQGFALTRNWPNPSKQLGGDCSSGAAVTVDDALLPRPRHARQGQLRQRRASRSSTTPTRRERDLDDEGARQLRRAEGLLRPGARPTGR